MSLLDGKLDDLLLPRDLAILRDAAQDAASTERDLRPLYRALADSDPVALLDLVLGPKAVIGGSAVDAALSVADELEAASSPAAVFRRLVDLAPARALGLLEIAATRHPAAGWILALAEKVEPAPGRIQLRAAHAHPAFPSLCATFASRGHVDALLDQASQGRPEPAAFLLAAGRDDDAVAAAILALAADPRCRLVPWLAAARGPGAERVLRRVLTGLTTRAAVASLQEDLTPFPNTAHLYALVLSGLRA